MNYHRLFSKFYNAPGQTSSEAGQFSEEPPIPMPPKGADVEEYSFQSMEETESAFDEIDPSDSIVAAEPLAAEDVRWFYKATDEKVWLEFNGYDSLLVENKYRDLKLEHLCDADIVEIDKVETCQDGSIQSVHCSFNLNESPVKKAKKDEDGIKDDCTDNKISVRGGMYEVDLFKMLCESIYWPGESYVITRGLYFYDGSWQPLEKECGETLEKEHLKLFGNKNDDIAEKPPAQSQSTTAIHSHHFAGYHVEWLSSSEIYLFWGGAPRQLVRCVSQRFGFNQTTGYRLRRGYRKKATLLERPPEITHVVFVIHGIGQKMDAGRIIRNTNALRINCEWLKSQYPVFAGGEIGRAELFPAKWRAGERGDAAKLLAAAAPEGTPILRRAINEAAMDVMYYTSPVYGKLVHDNLTNELNRLYTMFMDRNPNYKGSFSAVAHSLGCVILYDIITDYQMGCDKCTKVDTAPQQDKSTKLMFNLQQIFCLGSPLGVFLALRQSTSGTVDILPMADTRIYNIFHLSDPVAYRLEPLFACWLSKHPPLDIPHYSEVLSPSNQASPARSGWKLWSLVRQPWQTPTTIDNGDLPLKNKTNENSPKRVSFSEATETLKRTKEMLKKGPPSVSAEGSVKNGKKTFSSSETNEDNAEFDEKDDLGHYENFNSFQEDDDDDSSSESSNIPRKPEDILPYRIDYTFRDSFITNNYISAITSHTSYWTNYDIACFILSHLNLETDECEVKNTPHSSNNL